MPQRTRTQRHHYHHLAEALRRLETDLQAGLTASAHIPEEWHAIATRPQPQPMERITIRLDRDVLRFFRSMGALYQPRINAVLRAFMHARLAGVVQGAEAVDYTPPEDARHDRFSARLAALDAAIKAERAGRG